jgi:hypothetical protein
MSQSSSITDQQVTSVLSTYAGMVNRVLTDPERWLGMDEDPPPTAGFPARALDAVRDRAFGETTPASSTWSQHPVDMRVRWWVDRIGISAGLAAAAPRFLGALASRIPLQSALGAAAAGLAVCATAREHGLHDPAEWVPLLGTVLFDRELTAPVAAVPTAEESEERLAEIEGDGADADDDSSGLGSGARRAARTLWRLARALLDLGELLDHRPRGGKMARLLAQVPVVGVASGWLDERGGIRSAARETTQLLQKV